MRIIMRGFMSEKDRRHLVPFIATNKINAAREPESPRPLFSALQDSLTVEQANRILSEEEQPERTELFRLLISLRPNDYEKLGRSDTERNAAFREVVRNGMLAARSAIDALELIWIGGIHLNTDYPHAQLAVVRGYKHISRQEWMRMKILPHRWLPKSEWVDGQKRTELRPFLQRLQDEVDRLQALSLDKKPHYWRTIGLKKLPDMESATHFDVPNPPMGEFPWHNYFSDQASKVPHFSPFTYTDTLEKLLSSFEEMLSAHSPTKQTKVCE